VELVEGFQLKTIKNNTASDRLVHIALKDEGFNWVKPLSKEGWPIDRPRTLCSLQG
jgi:hypothetical protein